MRGRHGVARDDMWSHNIFKSLAGVGLIWGDITDAVRASLS